MTVDGYIAWEVYQDSFTKRRFNAFVRQDLLPIMKPFPEACSVLIMDNHSIHHSEELSEMCMEAGIVLLYLPAYSPDMNPIEQSFSQLKAWMRKNQPLAQIMLQDFEGFIQLAITTMQGKDSRGHFRQCGYCDADDTTDSEGSSSSDSSSDSE
jgi:hypothetical protein